VIDKYILSRAEYRPTAASRLPATLQNAVHDGRQWARPQYSASGRGVRTRSVFVYFCKLSVPVQGASKRHCMECSIFRVALFSITDVISSEPNALW